MQTAKTKDQCELGIKMHPYSIHCILSVLISKTLRGHQCFGYRDYSWIRIFTVKYMHKLSSLLAAIFTAS